MKALTILYKFSRPHTIWGSIFSITTLYIIACKGNNLSAYLGYLLLTLIAGVSCNIFIVGLNQIIDIEVDKINKPNLPIAAGTLSLSNAYKIIYTSLIISFIAAAFASYVLLIIIVLCVCIGIAYSVPPIQLKKHHLPAAISITLVRGIIVNIGMLLHFTYLINKNFILNEAIVPLTVFIIAFSIAIAWFKDLADTAGDAKYNFKTFPILYSKKTAIIIGTTLVVLAYGYTIFWSSFIHNYTFLTIGQSILFVLFIINVSGIKLTNQLSIQKFYKRFWIFFFAEYILFAAWFLYM